MKLNTISGRNSLRRYLLFVVKEKYGIIFIKRGIKI